MMPAARSVKCGICDTAVGKSKGSIMCCKCNLWLHLACAKITERHLALFTEKPESFSFTCAACTTSGVNDGGSFREEVRALSNSFNEFVKTSQDDLASFQNTLSSILSDFKAEISTCIKEMKSDIVNCNKLISSIDLSTTSKIESLQVENDILHRRLNRADIVVSGMPSGLDNLMTFVCSLCSCFDINISKSDIFHVCYMNNKKLILIKFNNVSTRDLVMRQYFKTRSLKLNDVLGGEIDSRVFLNDHFPPIASSLNSLCRKLKSSKIISRYRVLNSDKVKAKLTLVDGKEVVYDVGQCMALYNSNSGTVVI